MRTGRNWRLTAAAAIAAFFAGGAFILAAGLMRDGQRVAAGDVWREIAWPFPRDAWPPGRAFRCLSNICGAGTEVYLRPKIGFCSNCETGVTGDAEVDGVTDLDLISPRFVPLATGEQIRLADMPGRMRLYRLQMPDGGTRTATGLAISRQCDLVVAVVLWPAAPATGGQSDVTGLLSSTGVAKWLAASLDGR